MNNTKNALQDPHEVWHCGGVVETRADGACRSAPRCVMLCVGGMLHLLCMPVIMGVRGKGVNCLAQS